MTTFKKENMKNYKLKIKDIKPETANAVSITFEIPKELESEFTFKNGQYISLTAEINNEIIKRAYSISSCLKTDKEHRIAVKKVPNGKMSNWLNEKLKIGNSILVSTPEGRFVANNILEHKNYVFFATGSGITPIISIIKGLLSKKIKSKMILFYGNKNENDIIFKNEIMELKEKHENFYFYDIFSEKKKGFLKKQKLNEGFINQKKTIQLLKEYTNLNVNTDFFICGHVQMMEDVKKTLINLKILEKFINIEYFASPDKNEKQQKDKSVVTKCRIIIDEEIHDIDIPKGKTILEAALKKGIDAPYSCKGAVCSSCMAKIEEGTADLKMNHVLTKEELKNKYILTCQAVPTSKKITINFDN